MKNPPPEAVLAVLMPVYNEGDTISTIIRHVLEQPIVKQLVIVDDASTDETAARIAEWQSRDPRVISVRHDRNQGKGAALRTGFAMARAPIVIFQDGDLEYDPREYTKLCEPILAGEADVVFGSRFKGAEAHRVLYFWHYVANLALTMLSNIFTNLNLSDMECGYKTFRREILEELKLREDGFGIEPEVVAKTAALRISPKIEPGATISERAGRLRRPRIYEVSISYHGRTYEEGKKITWRDGLHAVRCILQYNLFRKPSAWHLDCI